MPVEVVAVGEGLRRAASDRLDALRKGSLLLFGPGRTSALWLTCSNRIFQLHPHRIAEPIPEAESWAQVPRSLAAQEGSGNRTIPVLTIVGLDHADSDHGVHNDAQPGWSETHSLSEPVQRCWSGRQLLEEANLIGDKQQLSRPEAAADLKDRVLGNVPRQASLIRRHARLLLPPSHVLCSAGSSDGQPIRRNPQ